LEFAISLRDGGEVLAEEADHEASRTRLLVCPECGEPVFFKKRWTPNETAFFSHYQEIPTVKLLHKCSLRAEDVAFRPASQVIHGIKKGQLVDRFQREFCRELHSAFGRYSQRFGNFIRASKHDLSRSARDELIRDVERRAPCNSILLAPLTVEDVADFGYGVADVCRFLRSSYGIWVSRFLYQTAYFLALVTHQRTLNEVIGRRLFTVDAREAILVLDNKLLRRPPEDLAEEVLAGSDRRNVAVFEIAPVLVSFLLLRWRRKGSLLPRLFAISGPEFRLRQQARSTQDSETGHLGKARSGTSATSNPAGPAPIAPVSPSLYQPSGGFPSVPPSPHRPQYSPAPGADRGALPRTSPYSQSATPRVFGAPQKLWYESGEVERSPAPLRNASSASAPKRPDIPYQPAALNVPRAAGVSTSQLVATSTRPAGPLPHSSSPHHRPSVSGDWADGFVPDGGYIPISQVEKLRRVVKSRWPNGYPFGASEWQFFQAMKLLVNLKTRRIYAEHQLQWYPFLVSVTRGGEPAFDVPRHQIVWALLGSD